MRALTAAIVVFAAACGEDGMGGPDAGNGGDGGGSGSGDGGGGSGDGSMTTDGAAVPPGCASGRSTVDRADDHDLDQIRILYVLPSDITDESRDTSGQICNSVRAFAAWFQAQAGSYLRFDTAGGLLDIGFVRLSKTDVQMRGSDPNNTSIATGTAFVRERIELELEAMGLIASNKLYGVYYEGSSTYACGGGAYPPLIVDRVGAMYLDGLPIGQSVPCGDSNPWGQPSLVPNYIDYGMLHELVHSMGIVAPSSPHQHSTGHVFDTTATAPNRDLMYSPRPGQPDPGWATNNPNGLLLDLGNDDYFQASAAVELSTMSLLAPLPDNAVRPYGW